MDKLENVYMKQIVKMHSVPLTIFQDRDSRFTHRFLRSLQEETGTKMCLSIVYHAHTNGNIDRTIQTLEGMLRAYTMEFPGNQDEHLPLVEFSFNKN